MSATGSNDNSQQSTSKLMVTTSRLATIAALILTAAWCKYNDQNYLGIPALDNLESWHGIMMLGGLFFSIIFASTTMADYSTMLEDYSPHLMERAKLLFWNILGLISAIVGISAVVQFKNVRHESHLSTIHSWIGIISIASVLYFIGIEAVKAYYSSVVPNTSAQVSLRFHQQTLVLAAILSTAIASVTGISEHFSRSVGCDKSDSEVAATACKIGNGIGLCVFVASLLAMMVITLQSMVSFARYRMLARIEIQPEVGIPVRKSIPVTFIRSSTEDIIPDEEPVATKEKTT